MKFHIEKLGFRNEQDAPRTIIVEPWADEYILLSQEEMSLVGINYEEPPGFYVIEHNDCSQVYLEKAGSDYYIIQNGRRININDWGESKGIEQDIVELLEAGRIAPWRPDNNETE
jgi:hypothetical protein